MLTSLGGVRDRNGLSGNGGLSDNRKPRVENWQAVLRFEISRHLNQPFVWGVSDCCMAADVVMAMTGFDPIASMRGYRSGHEARAALRQNHFDSVQDFIEQNFDEIPMARAQRGDLVFPSGEIPPLMSPAILDGVAAYSKGLSGSVIVPRELCARAFAV